MTSDRLRRAKELFADALERPAEQREPFIRATCGSDTELRNAVVDLLNAHEAAERFMHSPSPEPRPPAGAAHAPGAKVGPYTVVEMIGEGGFGTVYLAEQHEPVRRRVALKVIKAGMDTRKVVARFEAERQALAMMDHPGIASVLDAGQTEDGRSYFAMELIRGVPITEYCSERGLGLRERLLIFGQLCDAVHHAHQKGIIHRDIKPSNVLVVEESAAPQPKIIDFGIAKATGYRLGAESISIDGDLLGTPQYMSPEQAESDGKDVDTRSDVYALGVLLYELLTGSPPFGSDGLRAKPLDEVRRLIREVDPPTPSSRAPTTRGDRAAQRGRAAVTASTIRGELDWIVMRCLEKDRTRRYESAASLGADVRRHLRGEPVTAAPPSRTYRLLKLLGRHRVGVSAAGAVALVVIAAAVISTYLAIREAAARRQAVARGEEARLIAEFQGRMLSRLNAASVGGRLFQGLRDRYEAALEDAGVESAALAPRVEAFDVELARINSTDAAAALLEQSILAPATEAIERDFADNPVSAAAIKHALADVYSSLGMYSEALTLELASLETRRRELGDDHPDTLASMSNAATLQAWDEGGDGGRALAVEAYQRRRRALGPTHPLTLKSQAIAGMRLEDRAEGERLCAEAVSELRHHADTEPEAMIWALDAMLELLTNQQRMAEAEPLAMEWLELARSRWGDEHPETIHGLNRHGNILFHLRRLDECASVTRRSLQLSRRVWGDNHVKTVMGEWNLGFLLMIAGRYEESVAYLREFLERRRAAHASDDDLVLMAQKELGYVLAELGHLAEGEAMLRQALEQHRRRGDMASHNARGLTTRLARVLMAQRRFDEAETLLDEGLALMGAPGNADPGSVHGIESARGELLLRQGRAADAAPLLRRATEGLIESLGPRKSGTVRARVLLGRALTSLGRWQEAEDQLLAAEADFADALGATPRRHKACAQAIVELYASWHGAEPGAGHDAQAERWRARVATMPDRHPPLAEPP